MPVPHTHDFISIIEMCIDVHDRDRPTIGKRANTRKGDRMIAARNHVVHGRLVDDLDRLAVERLRAQVIFETLFISFVDCPEFHSSEYTRLSISYLERRLSGHDDE